MTAETPALTDSVTGFRARSDDGGDPLVQPLFRWSDLPWAFHRVLRKMAYSVVPIRAYCLLARLRGRLRASRVPDRVRLNIDAGLGDTAPEIERIARAHGAFHDALFLARLLPRLPRFESVRWPVEGLEHLDRALATGRGVILVTAHLGYGRLISPVLCARGYDVIKVVGGMANRVEADDRQRKWLARSSRFKRRIFMATQVFAGSTRQDDVYANLDMRPVFEALSKNRIVLFTGDGMRAARFVTLELLGRPHPFPAGFTKIAMLTGAHVLPAFAVEGGVTDPIRIEVHPPLPVDAAKSLEENVGLFADVLDRQIRQTPHLWCRWAISDYFQKALDWTEKGPGERYSGSFR